MLSINDYAFTSNEEIKKIYNNINIKYNYDFEKITIKNLYKDKILLSQKNSNWNFGKFKDSFYLNIPVEDVDKCESLMDNVLKLDIVYDASCVNQKMMIKFDKDKE